MTISGHWVVTAISGGKTSWLSPKKKVKKKFPVTGVEPGNRSFEEGRGRDGICGGCLNTDESGTTSLRSSQFGS